MQRLLILAAILLHFFRTFILVPMRTMGKISSVVVADAWKIDDRKTIMDINQKQDR